MDFIETYDKILTPEQCNEIITLFDKCSTKNQGRVAGEVDLTAKNSVNMDLYVNFNPYEESLSPENKIINNIIMPALGIGIHLYKKKYPFLDMGLDAWTLFNSYHISLFKEKEGGYFVEHCEAGSWKRSVRMLAWMFYLNDAKSGTRFYAQKRDIKPTVGKLVVWPAGWTHSHSGITPNKSDKYIITGWHIFRGGDE